MLRPKASKSRQKKDMAKLVGVTNSREAFGWVARTFDRKNIVIEGDSWVAYPRQWLIAGPNSNISDWIIKFTKRDHANTNILCLGSNGDTAEEMLQGNQLTVMTSLLKTHGEHIDTLLFSGGGNDVVGKHDLPPLLNQYEAGFTAEQCINTDNFSAKVQVIKDSYERLIGLRDQHAPNCKILTHTYDTAKPTGIGAMFLWGVTVTGPWIKPYLDDKDIPTELHLPIVKILLSRFRELVLELATQHSNFVVADTQGTLTPTSNADWLNEIHPTSDGFRRIAEKIYSKI